jgi:hypothetical protein
MKDFSGRKDFLLFKMKIYDVFLRVEGEMEKFSMDGFNELTYLVMVLLHAVFVFAF